MSSFGRLHADVVIGYGVEIGLSSVGMLENGRRDFVRGILETSRKSSMFFVVEKQTVFDVVHWFETVFD